MTLEISLSPPSHWYLAVLALQLRLSQACSSCGAAPIVVGALIASALLGSAGVTLCRDDEDETPQVRR